MSELDLPRSELPEDVQEERYRLALEVLTEEAAVPSRRQRPKLITPTARVGYRGLPLIDWSHAGVREWRPKASWPGAKRKPSTDSLDGRTPLPEADIVVMTWTSDEWLALHHVFSSGLRPEDGKENLWRRAWLPYRRDFYRVMPDLWTRRLVSIQTGSRRGVPSLNKESRRWGSYRLVSIGSKKVLLFKSDLHLGTDGEKLPLARLVRQVLKDSQASLVLSTGTSGGVSPGDLLGDCVISNSARFKLGKAFENASFNGETFKSNWSPSQKFKKEAERRFVTIRELDVIPPSPNYPAGSVIRASERTPRMRFEGRPIVTTDYFEFGTTQNKLGEIGCCVEMDDAVVGMVASEAKTDCGFIRNISDPIVDARLPRGLQTAWAVYTYQSCGLYTSFNSALATWAVIAGHSA
jgi:nucleoside phosphorylase